MYLICLPLFIGGVLFGTHFSLFDQAVLLVLIGIGIKIQPFFKEMEVLILVIWLQAFVAGLVVGDISYFLQSDMINISNPFAVD